MSKTKSLYAIINSPAPAKDKHKRKWNEPIPIGHQIAIKIFEEGIYLDTLFADNIDICRRHTIIHFNQRLMEVYPTRVRNVIQNIGELNIFYDNNVEFEVIRIN